MPKADAATGPDVIIDAQVHSYERDHLARPWSEPPLGETIEGVLPEVSGSDLVEAMDAVGVHGALLVSAWWQYRYDWSYAVSVHRDFPDRFALIAPIDPENLNAAEMVSEWSRVPGAVGIRLLSRGQDIEPNGSQLHRVMTQASAVGLPICLSRSFHRGEFSVVERVAAAYPDAQYVLDQMGLAQVRHPPRSATPFAELPGVLSLSKYPNIALKLTGITALSHESLPFRDLRDSLARIFDSFGVDRSMWGSDWTRVNSLVTLHDAVSAFRDTDLLNERERQLVMGGALMKIFNWHPVPKTRHAVHVGEFGGANRNQVIENADKDVVP